MRARSFRIKHFTIPSSSAPVCSSLSSNTFFILHDPPTGFLRLKKLKKAPAADGERARECPSFSTLISKRTVFMTFYLASAFLFVCFLLVIATKFVIAVFL